MTTNGAVKSAAGGRAASKLTDQLRVAIRKGEIAPGRFLPSERELSREHGLAKMTVRRALKVLEREGFVAAEPRQGYRVLGRARDPQKGFPVAFVVTPDEADNLTLDGFQRLLLGEFRRAATRRGWSLLAVGSEGRSYGEVMDLLEGGRISGAVLVSGEVELQQRVERSGAPVVMADTWREDSEIDSIVQDGFRGGLLAASHLLARGHRRIGWLGLDVRKGSQLAMDRYCGAAGGLARAGLSLSVEATATNRDADMERAAMELLSASERPTGILALWQTATQALVRASRVLGLKPGEDFEMVGWANEEEYERSFCPLFSPGEVQPAIVWRVASMAETALARLEERRANPQLPAIHLRIPTRLELGDQAKSRAGSGINTEEKRK